MLSPAIAGNTIGKQEELRAAECNSFFFKSSPTKNREERKKYPVPLFEYEVYLFGC